jgi:hypothetical protein
MMAVRAPMAAAFLAVSLAVLAATASQAIQTINPSMALRVNPFNDSARIATIAAGLADEQDAAQPDLEQLAQTGSRISPSDARYLSLTGMILMKQGRVDDAQRYFEDALSVMPTEIQALFGRFGYFLSRKETGKALQLASLIARRWPNQWNMIEPYLPYLLETDEAIAEASKALGNDPLSRDRIIRSLVKQPSTLEKAVALIEQWKADGVALTELRPLSISVSNALFTAKDYTRSYFLFRTMLDDAQKQVTGYIHNAQFRQKPSGSIFDWRINAPPGASMMIRDNGLEIRFRNSPVRFSGLQQYFRLSPGKYALQVNYSTRAVVAPKPMKLAITCVGATKSIAALELSTGTQDKLMDEVPVDVPAENCPALRISMINDYSAISWSNRYSGVMTLHGVTIERAAEPAS